MKKLIIILLLIIPLVSMAQVEKTPFEKGIEKTWQYVQDMGYNTNIEITYDTTEVKIYGQQPFNKYYKHLKAKKPSDDSMVDIVIQIDDEMGTQTMWNVLFTWCNKKLMPKNLKGITEYDFWNDNGTCYHLKKDGYKNSYAVGLIGNPNRPIRFNADIHTFSFIVNGIPYSGWY